MIGLLAAGRMGTPGTGMAETLRRACAVGPAKPLLVLGVLWLLRCVLALRYGLLFSGTMTAERMENLPYFLFAISSVVYVAAAGAVVWAAAAVFERRLRHVGVVAFVLEVAWVAIAYPLIRTFWCMSLVAKDTILGSSRQVGR